MERRAKRKVASRRRLATLLTHFSSDAMHPEEFSHAAPPREIAEIQPSRPGGRRRTLPTWLSLLALFLLVVGARLWLVQHYTTPLPFWDQWSGEGSAIIKPWLEGRLRFVSLFDAHNEHRIFLTRVLVLGLFAANGQWDAQLEMTVNALLCGGIALVMAAAALRWCGLFVPRATILVAIGLFFTLPFGWENTLAGFQSQFYFLLLFSLGALCGLGMHQPFSRGWWLGALSAALACLAMASGFLAAAAVLALRGVRSLRRRALPDAGELTTGLLCLTLIGVGWTTRVTVPWHAALQAESGPAFLLALGRCLAWPWTGQPWLAFVMQFPLLLLAGNYALTLTRVASEELLEERRGAELLLGVGCWVWLQAMATAYARGGGNQPPPSRYHDFLALGVLVNCFAACALLRRLRRAETRARSAWQSNRQPAAARGLEEFLALRAIRHFPAACWGLWRLRQREAATRFFWKHRAAAAAMPAWLAVLGIGLARMTGDNFRAELPERRDAYLAQESNVRGYLATGDFARYLAGKPQLDIPYPDVAYLARLLDDPTLRAVLPADVRAPLPLAPATAADNAEATGFAPDGYYPSTDQSAFLPCWGSYTALGEAAQGAWRGRTAAPASLPYLRFAFAGDLGEPGLSFALRDLAAAGRLVDFRPARPPRAHWRIDYLRAPGRGGFEIVASDRSATRWFAFSAPVEVGRWSYWSGWLLRRGGAIFTVGALLGFFLAAGSAVGRWRQRFTR